MMDTISTSPMENTRLKTLSSSESSSICFNRHRRSHLKSETFRSLVQILTHCSDFNQRSLHNPIAQDDPKLDNGIDEFGKETEKAVGDELDRDHNTKLDVMVIDESGKADDFGIECGSSNRVQIVVDESEHMVNVEETKKLISDHFTNLSTSSVDNNQTVNEPIEFVGFKENYLALENFLMEEPDDEELLPVDNTRHSLCIDGETSFDKGLFIEDIEADINTKDKNTLDEFEFEFEKYELQQKNKELETLNCISDKMVSPISNDETEMEQIEDGEIYGEMGFSEQPVEILENVLEPEEEKVDNKQSSQNVIGKKIPIATPCEQKPRAVVSYHDLDIANDMNNNSIDYRVTKKMGIKNNYKITVPVKSIEDEIRGDESKEALNWMKTCHGDITMRRSSLEENATENGALTPSSSQKDDSVIKKRKRSGATATKKEKEKRRKRIKRAEKNRQQGVKRLKLQPVLKPKVIKICEHYMKGRCKKGDQCSFSHDAIPLTKSTPCSHFARKSCMKGDDCPYDHELSKYPCINFVSNGSCTRGDSCSFSHKIQVKEDSTTNSNVPKPAISNKNGKSHPLKNTNQNVAETVMKPPSKPPKGMSFLSFGKPPLPDSIKLKQGSLSPKGNMNRPSALDAIQSLNQAINSTLPAIAPNGVNLFSFDKASSIDLKQTDLRSTSENGIATSALNNFRMMKQASFMGNQQHGQINMHEISKKDSVGVNLVSFGNASSNDLKLSDLPSPRENCTGTGTSALNNFGTMKQVGFIGNQHGQMKMHEISKKESPGVNFFSLGKASSSDSKQADSPSNGKNCIATSASNHSSNIIPSASITIHNMCEISRKDLPGVNPFSLGKDTSNNSIIRQHILPTNKESEPKKLQYSSLMSAASSSLVSSGEILGRLSNGHKNMASSSQKALLSTLAFAAKYEPQIKMK